MSFLELNPSQAEFGLRRRASALGSQATHIARGDTAWISGQRVNTASNPAHTANRTTLKPLTTPRMCGIVFLKPNVAPDAVNITLFGPGVMDMTKE